MTAEISTIDTTNRPTEVSPGACPSWCQVDHEHGTGDRYYFDAFEHERHLARHDADNNVDLYGLSGEAPDVIVWLDGDDVAHLDPSAAAAWLETRGRMLLAAAGDLRALEATR